MNVKLGAILAVCLSTFAARAANHSRTAIDNAVNVAVQPIMRQYNIPGMAVGIVAGGHTYVLNYGLASKMPAQPVTGNTLFELGSVSKTFTATLAAYAQVTGHLSLNDTVGKFLPLLRGMPFGRVTLLELGTHTPGSLPLQVPNNVHNDDQLIHYFKQWRPACPPGTCRTYTNIGIGTLGLITARAMHGNFAALMEQRILRPLGMTHTYINLPQSKMLNYAQGYTAGDRPIRMVPGELWQQAYGVRTTARDMLRFLQANMGLLSVDPALQRAIVATHTGYFQAGGMTQDLIWEQYPYPVALETILRGNSSAMAFNPIPVTRMSPPQKPQPDVWLNKTGSTNGFTAYIAFIPEKRIGIILLANKNYPIKARVTAAYQILHSLPANAKMPSPQPPSS